MRFIKSLINRDGYDYLSSYVPLYGLSDYVCCLDEKYYNYLPAGTYGSGEQKVSSFLESVVRKGRKYFMTRHREFIGYYVWYNRVAGALYILLLKPIFSMGHISYKERGRCVILRKGCGLDLSTDFEALVDSGFERTLCEHSYFYDVCGYNVFPDDSMKYVRPSSKCILDFFGAPIIDADGKALCMFDSFSLLGIIKTINQEPFQHHDYIQKVDRIAYVACSSIPKHVVSALNRAVTIKSVLGYVDIGRLNFCIIDRFRIRFFGVAIEHGKIKCYEYERVDISDIGTHPFSHFFVPLIWYDRHILENTPFRYMKDELDSLCDDFNRCGDFHRSDCFLSNVIPRAASPFINEIYALKDKRAYKFLTTILWKKPVGILPYIHELFCVVDDREGIPLNKKLGVSKPFFQHMINHPDDMSQIIRYAKNMFSSCPERLSTMNDMESKFVCSSLSQFGSAQLACVNMLVTIYGPDKFMKYIEYISTINEAYYAKEHMYYYQYLYTLKDHNMHYPWNPGKYNILGLINKANRDIQYLPGGKHHDIYEKYFKDRETDWERYCYEKGCYVITYPKHPDDLIKEGNRLRHCVGNYVKQAACGMVTILFLRKKPEIDEPFITIELMDGLLRQAHGYKNNNLESFGSDVIDFVISFCKEKNIGYRGAVPGNEFFGPPTFD